MVESTSDRAPSSSPPTLKDVIKRAAGLSLDRFRATFPNPVLLVEPADAAVTPAEPVTFETMRSDLTPARSFSPGTLGMTAVVCEVTKSNVNRFTSMITLGRAKNNDIFLDFPSISKFHAFFVREADGRWFVTDAGSTNGTAVNGQRLVNKARAPLQNGAELRLGTELRARFFDPGAFYNVLASSGAR